MSTYIAHPVDEAENWLSDDTAHLLSTPANAERLRNAIANEVLGQGRPVSLDEILK
ncbi:MAG: hypothetical protein ACRYFZ_13175 [Janthinobacterium lividum]